MNYKVSLQPPALNDLDEAYEWIARRSPESAGRWYRGFVEALRTLNEHPQRCGLAPESRVVGREIRQFIYRTKSGRSNRALFTIFGDEVRVLHIRRPGQPLMTAEELGQ